jgi:hypothetical protein
MNCPFTEGQNVLVSSTGILNGGGSNRPDDKWYPGVIKIADNGAHQSWVFFDGAQTPKYCFWSNIKPAAGRP